MHLLFIQSDVSIESSIEQSVPSTTHSCNLIGLLKDFTRTSVVEFLKNPSQYNEHGSFGTNLAFQK